ncbi:Tryptophan synthase beta chain [Methanosarcinaceae archaeon Ag5]|uniref:Tryptophan synthase beta chain n=1 Tax=Methanolapillus africanus TaxID=3028297 RepID=A0AAE4SFA2_9EURY|nr:Tryptophan synthase beta chain [Methanosarcinaceae archaeon Ag5]
MVQDYHKVQLDENDMPKKWYNIVSDLKTPLDPPVNPATGQVATAKELEPVFAKELIRQEMSTDQFIDIPPEVLDILKAFRPNPLRRAVMLEKYLKTPAKIYYKYEGESPTGSHKTNSSIPQVYYNMKQGVERLTTETGAGQWGSALAFACNHFGLESMIYMVRSSYAQKPHRKTLMNLWNGKVLASPSTNTEFGRRVLKETPDTPGTLGIAITEAVEDALSTPNTRYTLGSVLNHVMLHQTIIGLEAQKQFEMIEDYPDYVIACCGGGSNFAGLAFPFVKDKIDKNLDTQIIAVEPESCPSLTQGEFRYDYGDTGAMTPKLKMYTLGCEFVPPSMHAGGLRYHGCSPIVSNLYADGLIKAEALGQKDIFNAGIIFSQTEGITAAPESTHAICSAINKALECKKTGEEKTIVFNLSGHGLLDMSFYQEFLEGKIQ